MHEKFLKKRIEALSEHEQELMDKYGWLVHYVYETKEGEMNGLANIHTHGIEENFKHKDIQVVLPIMAQTIHPILAGIVGDIKKGRVFEPEVRNKQVFKGMDAFFRTYKEGNRTVLRLFVPDPNGKLPFEEGCEEIYARQMEQLPEYK